MKAHARHILVETEQAAQELKRRLESGGDFAALAREHSQCPSAEDGGDLGEISPGEMVREFDNVVFFADVGRTHGPVKTPFGYHLIEILERSE